MHHAAIIGTGSYAPENIITNDNLAELVETNDEWISSRTGIKERRISTGENTSDLAYQAALRALEAAKMDTKDIDLIICATITPDSFMPSVACIIQDKLGATNAAAFDLTAACTGLIYAIVIADQFIGSGMYKNILVVGAETLSKVLDWEDRSTCVLFGDGAGAVLLSATKDRNGVLAANLLADGSKQSFLTCPAIPMFNPFVELEREEFKPKIEMQGQEVFKYAVRSVTDNIKTVLNKAGLASEDIRYIIPHQANRRIIEQAAKLGDLPIEKFYMNLDRFGNTSAASIGMALDELMRSNELKPGDKLILVGFGGGMTSGAVLIEV
ncbi:MAG TPA: beta-ketoacyl-ACP synthase III [Mobilitalea sp.]|nr:beta-ketoacyl-ACP synthase III [Mobilitalea sp.]